MSDHVHEFTIVIIGISNLSFVDYVEWAFCVYCGFHLPWISDKKLKWVM
jgi:hypothetical protein